MKIEQLNDVTLIHGDCIELMKDIPDESIDCILTDPPYKYLKNQKLEVDFDEKKFFNQAQRILKPSGFIVLFGRGTSFYRWNTLLANRGFIFKEEFIWDKGHCTSPLMSISRIHETVSIHTKKNGILNKVKIPYLEMKKHDIEGIITDMKRVRVILNNPKSLDAVLCFLKNNKRDTSDSWNANNLSISSDITKEERTVSVMRAVNNGMNEKSIIRTDRTFNDSFTKHKVTCDKRESGDRQCNAFQSIEVGMNEKSIIKITRDNYTAIHPTQKPVRLLERLLALTTNEGDFILDPFAGSGSTGIACINTNRNFLGFELDSEYYTDANERILNAKNEIKEMQRQQNLF